MIICWISSYEIVSSLNGDVGEGGIGSQDGCTDSLGSLLYSLLKKMSSSLALSVGFILGLSSSKLGSKASERLCTGSTSLECLQFCSLLECACDGNSLHKLYNVHVCSHKMQNRTSGWMRYAPSRIFLCSSVLLNHFPS